MRTKYVDGMIIPGCAPKMAEKALKDVSDGSILLCAINGKNLYIKEDGVVRDSTQKEWEDMWAKKNGKKVPA
jgi:hypothetical protein